MKTKDIEVTISISGDHASKHGTVVKGQSMKLTPFEVSLALDKKFKDNCLVAKIK